jgi:hypothetical protein
MKKQLLSERNRKGLNIHKQTSHQCQKYEGITCYVMYVNITCTEYHIRRTAICVQGSEYQTSTCFISKEFGYEKGN